MASSKNSNNKTAIGAVVVLFIVAVAIGWVIFNPLQYLEAPRKGVLDRSATRSASQADVTETTPTPAPLVQGPQTYSVSMKGDFQAYEIKASTIDPKQGGSQKLDVKVRHEGQGTISSVVANIKTDEKSKTQNLNLTAGDNKDGTWSGSWVIDDTYDKNFQISFTITDSNGNKAPLDFTIR